MPNNRQRSISDRLKSVCEGVRWTAAQTAARLADGTYLEDAGGSAAKAVAFAKLCNARTASQLVRTEKA